MRNKPNLAVRLQENAHLLITEPALYRGRWISEFGCNELHIELGCGKGRFTVETAMKNPDILFVALEKSANAMVIALERVSALGLKNVRFINAFAEYLIEYFAPDEASRIYINFCDPWPSNRHAKRRLTNQRFLRQYSQILVPNGEIHFKTDNHSLFEFSLCELERGGFMIAEVVSDLHERGPVGVMTDYELKFFDKGLPIFKFMAINVKPGPMP